MGEGRPRRGGFLASARLVGLCTLLSRVLGMVRDVLTSHVFGAGLLMDAFGLAYLVPNLFRRLFGEGALTTAFVPSFVARLEGDRKAEAFALLNRLVTRLVVLLSVLAAVGVAVTFLLPLHDDKAVKTAELTRIMLPYVILICGAAILGGALNSLRHFFAPAFAPVLLNVVWIIAIVWLRDIRAVAWAILIGGLLQFLLMVPPLARRGVRLRPDPSPDAGLREVGARFLPMVVGLALVQVNELMGRVIAEVCVPGDGGVSSLYYANQLFQLPLALIGVSVGTAIFPLLSGAVSGGRPAEFSTLVQKAMRGTLYLAIPATVGIILFARPIVELLYEHGRFGPADTTRVTAVLVFYVASLGFWCANGVQSRAFYAQGDTRTPVRVSVAMMVVSLGLNLILVWPLAEQGIALASTIAGAANFATLNLLLRRRYPDIELRSVWRTSVLSLAGSAVMAGVAWAAWSALRGVMAGDTLLKESTRLLVPMAAGMAAYVGITWLFRMPEARSVLRR